MTASNDCIFCKFGRGEAKPAVIHENDKFMAFLDVAPATRGQALIIPKKVHIDYIFDVPDSLMAEMFIYSKTIAKAIDKALNPKRTALVVHGLDVSHVHVKLYPIYPGSFLDFQPKEPRPSNEELRELAGKISVKIKN